MPKKTATKPPAEAAQILSPAAESVANIKAAAELPRETLEATPDDDLEAAARAYRGISEPDDAAQRRALYREAGRRVCIAKHEGKKHRRELIDPNLERTLTRGWLCPYLLDYDAALWGRWDYLCEAMEAGALPDAPIPQVEWNNQSPFGGVKNGYIAGGIGYKHLSDCLDLVENCGRLSWTGWSSFSNIDYFLDWLLFGFGFLKEEPREPSKGASMRLYQFFDLAILQCWPWDYWGDLLADQRHGRHLGFYPTPLPICQLMAGITFSPGRDHRAESFNEPCCGTGRILLVASNYCMNLSGMDISATMVKCSLVNGYLYAPWMVKPLPFLSKGKAAPSDAEEPPEQQPAPPVNPAPKQEQKPAQRSASRPKPVNTTGDYIQPSLF